MSRWILLLAGLALLVVLWPGGAERDRARGARTRAIAGGAELSAVVVYTRPSCGWCRKTMAWLDAREVGYENRDIDADPQSRDQLMDLTGHPSVPVVIIDGQLVRGFDPARMRSLLATL